MPPSVVIVSPYAASANNGNWRTAQRWAHLLRRDYNAIVRTPLDPLAAADLLVALHARRSHASIAAWCREPARGPCVLVLTGTDLYRDIPQGDPAALESLRLADRLIVLQQRAIQALPAPFAAKATVVYQSAPVLSAVPKSPRTLRALFVGHLREEKDPLTFVRAAAALSDRRDIPLAMVGGVRDAALAQTVQRVAAAVPNLALIGELSHAATRERIRRADLLVVPSRMEGGANVIVEAVTSGTAVLASDCDGNVGMLGEDYAGYFGVGDAAALAGLLGRCRDEPSFLARLAEACAARARQFEPDTERRTLLEVLAGCRAP